ncbi:SGNH/GDSL hydrolase family protein [Streptomyces sp. KL116D]|uniref:SGNH/GDSL hydrolase family protein n=1 Tax=Streptomyces sp. KL116D TaxID=3045152 RepID=UPI003556BA3F
MARRQVGNHGTDRCTSRRRTALSRQGVRAVGAQPALTMLGDSTAAGAGRAPRRQTPARAARVGTRGGGRARVELRNAALPRRPVRRPGPPGRAELADPAWQPDVCVIMIGANDVTHRIPAAQVRTPPLRGRPQAAHGRCGGGRGHLSRPRRRRAGATAAALAGPARRRGSPPPRRRSARWSRRAHVSLGDLLGPEFSAARAELFGPTTTTPRRRVRDGGDGRPADPVRLPGPVAGGERGRRPRRGFPAGGPCGGPGGQEGGTEVTAAMPTVRGPWALLKRRRRRQLSAGRGRPRPATETTCPRPTAGGLVARFPAPWVADQALRRARAGPAEPRGR